jgi:hypothetical protein
MAIIRSYNKVVFVICMINLRAKDVIDALDTVVTTFVANLPKISILIFLLGTVQHGSQNITEFS